MKITPILGQPFCWRVQSRSRPQLEHFVNWVDESCTCESYSMNRREHLERTQKNFRCAHLLATRDACWLEMLETYRSEVLAQ